MGERVRYLTRSCTYRTASTVAKPCIYESECTIHVDI